MLRWRITFPRAALAGILVVSAFRMVDRKQLRYYLRATRFDAGIVLITALAAVAISVEFCILIGTMLSFVLYVPRAARLHLSELTVTPERVIRERTAGDPPCGRIVIFDLEGEMFFGSSPELERHFDSDRGTGPRGRSGGGPAAKAGPQPRRGLPGRDRFLRGADGPAKADAAAVRGPPATWPR